MNEIQNIDKLVGDVRTLLTQSRQATVRAINTAMVTFLVCQPSQYAPVLSNIPRRGDLLHTV